MQDCSLTRTAGRVSRLAVFSRKTVLVILFMLVLISLAVRYPLVEHERFQTDSYTMHILSKSIVDNGYARWTLHPLSYIGYYPLSYPSGVPFLLAEVSSMTGASVEVSILLMNMALAVLFCLSVFMLCRLFIMRDEYVLLATFFGILGSRFVDTTYWDGSARGPLVVIMVLLVFVAFQSSSPQQRKLIAVAALLAIGCFSMHHMAILLLLFGLGYLFAVLQIHYLVTRVRTKKRFAVATWNLGVAVLVSIIAFGFLGYLMDITLMGLQKTSLFDLEPPALSIVLNMGVTYTNQIGFILVFAVLGLPALIARSRLSVQTLFPITVSIAFIPMLGNSIYVSMILAPFISILGVSWLAMRIRSAKVKKSMAIVLAFLIVTSIALPLWSSARWNEREYLSGEKVEVDSRLFSDATYLTAAYDREYAACNVKITMVQLAANSDMRFLSSGLQLVIAGEVESEDVRNNISWSSAPFPRNLYVWFEYEGEGTVDFYVQNLMIIGLSFITTEGMIQNQAREYFSDKQRLLVTIDNNHETSYVSDYGIHNSAFARQLESATWPSNSPTYGSYSEFESYALYKSGRSTFYLVELPI